ncbi:MAG: DUF433 domain-containing protein [Anaerolineae bacterium]
MNARIVSDPDICGGEPCIAGTRILVCVIPLLIKDLQKKGKKYGNNYDNIDN